MSNERAILSTGLVLLLLFAVACGSHLVTPPLDHPQVRIPPRGLLWEVRDPVNRDVRMFLFGSVHAGNPSMFPLDPGVEDAFERSDALAVEVDLTRIPGDELRERMARGQQLPAEQMLADLVSSETYRLTERALERHAIPMREVARLQPWAVAAMIQRLELAGLGYFSSHAVDSYFARRASGAKPVIALESLEAQIELLSSLPPGVQEAFLRDVVGGGEELASETAVMMAAWSDGDAKALERVLFAGGEAGPATAALHERLIFTRNESLGRRLEQMLAGSRRWFVVVGAAHLIGERGIVAHLREKGYVVRRAASQSAPGSGR